MDKTKKSLIVPICVVCGIVLFLVFGFIIGVVDLDAFRNDFILFPMRKFWWGMNHPSP